MAVDLLTSSALPYGVKRSGKVRDVYEVGDKLVLVTTDRLSAFDRQLAVIPSKGAILNLISAYWMNATRDICPNALVSVPHPNVSVMKRCATFRVEVVVRAYLTGTTSTSIWSHYSKGARVYCGHTLPDGLRKNAALPNGPWVTPTTKEEAHDVPISGEQVVTSGLMTAADWALVSSRALAVFRFGQAKARENGLILVDTKYEFGRDEATGEVLLIDEVHTPDSSRFWLANSYEACFAEEKEPENIDKEFLRIWFRDHCDPYGDVQLPVAPPELVTELSSRYVKLYEMITGTAFAPVGAGAKTLPAATASISVAATSHVLIVRTGGEDVDGEAVKTAREVVTRGGGAIAAEILTLNADETPLALVLAAQAAAGKCCAALVIDGTATCATAGVLAVHGKMPVVFVGTSIGEVAPSTSPIACVASRTAAVAFTLALANIRV